MNDVFKTFTKFQWMQEAVDLINEDEDLSSEDWNEILQTLWDHLPPKFHSKVMKRLESKYKSYDLNPKAIE